MMTAAPEKKILVIAGPNGAGKTTFAGEFLPNEAACPNFVNADLIAGGLAPFAPDSAVFRAGRLMLEEIRSHVDRRENFAFETTLSGRGYARLIPAWQTAGYRIKLFFLKLDSFELAIARIGQRVRNGGHNIPESIVRQRFSVGFHNFETLYKSLVDEWALYDNSGATPLITRRRSQAMTSKTPNQSQGRKKRGPDLVNAEIAIRRAARKAREIAKKTGIPVVILKDGRIQEEALDDPLADH